MQPHPPTKPRQHPHHIAPPVGIGGGAMAGGHGLPADLPPLPPGSALRFQSPAAMHADKRFPPLLQNLEGEMSKLLEWASTGDAQQRRREAAAAVGLHGGGMHATHTAEVRREEVRDFLKDKADVHQRRAKRREIAESTAVRLPKEVQAGRLKRGGKDREVSYLSDGAPAPHSAAVPASVIPDAFRIVLESPLPTREPNFYSTFGAGGGSGSGSGSGTGSGGNEDGDGTGGWNYNDATRKFEAVLFPSKVPAGRRDVVLLHAWVNDMIARLKQTSSALREEEMLKDAQLLFSVAFHEIIRQVSVHCLERGYLMGKIWWSEMELFQRLLQLNRRSEALLTQERGEWASERSAMQSRIARLEEELGELKRAERRVVRTPRGSYDGEL